MKQQSCDCGLNRGGKNQLPQLVIVLFTPSRAQVGELLLPSGVSARSDNAYQGHARGTLSTRYPLPS